MNKHSILLSYYQIKGDKNNSFWDGLNIFLNIFIFGDVPSVFGSKYAAGSRGVRKK